MLPHAFNFLAVFGRPRPEPTKKFNVTFDHDTPDGYQFFLAMGPLPNADTKYFKGDVAFWKEVMQHGTYDNFWKARNIRQHLKQIRPAVMTVGGWFDAENLFGALETYKAVEANGPKSGNMIVMGPWFHGGWSREDGSHLGHVPFNAKTSEYYRSQIELPFFEYHLKGKGTPSLPDAMMFETGTNEWKRFDAWPPKAAKTQSLYLGANGTLGAEPPSETDEVWDEYVSDPAKPVPFIDNTAIGMTREYMVGDQRFAGRRPDVLVYQGQELEKDVTVAGPIRADLYVSTTGTDSDWVVKVIDVYPNDYPDPDPNPTGVRMGGFQQLVRGDVMRGKFRESFESPVAFTSGKPTRVTFTLPDVNHTFRSGHRIMLQIQSTWFPLIDRNPQTLVDIYSAKESDFQKATQHVYRSREMPSRIQVLVMP
jgi:putative CocE/NonD family hydrolase